MKKAVKSLVLIVVIFLWQGLLQARINPLEKFPEAFYHRMNSASETVALSGPYIRNAAYRADPGGSVSLARETFVYQSLEHGFCAKKGLLTISFKGSPKHVYCMKKADWAKLEFKTYDLLQPEDQSSATSASLEALDKITLLGLHQRVDDPTHLQGPYENADNWWGYRSLERNLEKMVWVFRVPHQIACNEKTQYTVSRIGDAMKKGYFCIDKPHLRAATTSEYQVLWTRDFQVATAEARANLKQHSALEIELAHRGRPYQDWYLKNPEPKAGTYFQGRDSESVRGAFATKYKDGIKDGYTLVEEEYAIGCAVFLSPNLPPCDERTEYTVFKKDNQVYYCLLKEDFNRGFFPNNTLLSVLDVAHARPQDQAYIKNIQKEREREIRESLTEMGVKNLTAIAQIKPFERLRKAEQRRGGPAIRVFEIERDDCPDCYLVQYFGPLYEACGGFCKMQGYSVLIHKDGRLEKFLDSSLIVYVGSSEVRISKEGLQVFIDILNGIERPVKHEGDSVQFGNTLATTFETLSKKGITESDKTYAATMSRLSGMWGAGNSFGTFADHISLVRKDLKLGAWPTLE